jgi:hypothetical protein
VSWGDHFDPFMEHKMKTFLIFPVLVLSVAFVSPASANWFSNPDWNINLHVGSAPSPTPDDIRAGRQPMLVRDADGNIIAMIDPTTGKIIATAEPPPTAAQPSNGAAPAKAVAPAR